MTERKIKIEKGIPLIDRQKPRYPISDMDVGDSFVVPFVEENRVKCAIQYYRRTRGIKCSTRRVLKNRKQMIRVWRVK